MDILNKLQRHKAMKANRAKDTCPERSLRLALWHQGLHYRKNYRKLPGSPDIALTRQKIAIFVDGDFWHAHGHEKNPGEQIVSHKIYWVKKLTRNVERDREVNDALTELGWVVLRFWESDIKKDLQGCVSKILEFVK